MSGAPICPKCGDRVYFQEERSAAGKKWHEKCFKCGSCNKRLDSTNVTEHEGEEGMELFCNSCHRKKFGPKGYGFSGGAAGLSTDGGEAGNRSSYTGTTGGSVDKTNPNNCPRCGKAVYFAEQVLSLDRKWHKLCFRCLDCNRGLDSTNAAGHEGEAFCKGCHGKRYGPKGYGFAGGAGTGLSMDTGKRGEVTRDNVPATAQAYAAPTTELSNLDLNGDAPKRTSVASKFGGAPKCPRCTKSVYAAEKINGPAGSSYHKACFRCKDCGTSLESGKECSREDIIFCKGCYGKSYGPKGYGYGGGAGALSVEGK
ncbi:unnamed protein product [Owenia fusiformis]|uniref:Uncharacterized protein n=1 Tax=Owenia fusiformis TaxID=6347 RepID=A0A8J1UK58_OWEFU|nr:unnamed protein product [Owenia fusiformis]